MDKLGINRLKSNNLWAAFKNRCMTLQAIELAGFFASSAVQVTDLSAVFMGVAGEVDCAVGAPLAMLVGLLQSSPRSHQERREKRKTV
ncbi:hypothetical protein FEI13_14840 [Halomonas urmiana]|uniref:Uncharacterized protein n=1 Tax=Halomonas urmiana TaxID=490901 RepID=A0A5R8MDL1_9GAMM|nr:hypothetical protein [Halomonas urmiana]TLF47652.1 hypothetical protein FEI13_14840 [Halomonas urmiana]